MRSYLDVGPPDFIDHGQITKKRKEQVFILAYDTHIDKLSVSVKFRLVILYGSRVMAIFAKLS